MGECFVKVRINQSDEFLVLLYDDTFRYVWQIVQFIFDFFGVDVLSAGAEQQVLAASLDGDIAFGVHQGEVACVQPAVFVDHCFCRFVVLVISQHHVRAFADDFANDIFRIGRQYPYVHTRRGFSARTRLESCPVFVADDRTAFCHAVAYCIREVYHFKELFHLLVESCSTYDDFSEVSTERFDHFFAYGCFYLVVDDGYFE